MTRKTKSNKIDTKWIYQIEDKYKPSDDIFCEDDILYYSLKKALQETLNETERRIIISYAELGNIKDTAKLFKVSPTTIWKQIKTIQRKVKEFLQIKLSKF